MSGEATGAPRRILLLSANMGEGHNATARAVEQAARRLWPDVETSWLDTLQVMGAGVGPVFRRIYVVNVQSTPWLYEFFYDSLWRYRWFATASKRFVGAWVGRRLERHLRELRPDAIVSTYPLGSAGLEWLRRHRRLDVPVSAWISDFAPHPFWVYGDLDQHYVMHQVSLDAVTAAEPRATAQACAPPVVDAFRPGDRSAARAALGLDPDALVVLLSCGSFGFGTVERAVDALLDAGPGIQVVAVCGRNEALRARLAARPAAPGRLLPLGWVDDMPTLTVAADAVVTNAGGATALEAVACERAVLMFEPIAAHGRANAELMARSGLAVLCETAADLARTVTQLRADPERLAALEAVARDHVRRYQFDDAVREAITIPPRELSERPVPVRAEDVFFLYADTPEVTQQVGGLAIVDTRKGSVPASRIVAEADRRLSELPNLRLRPVPRGPWRRPGWERDDTRTVREHISERWLGAAGEPETFPELLSQFFSTPVDCSGAPWELVFVHGLPDGRSAIVVKLHHSLGDGFGVISVLGGLLDGRAVSAVPGARRPAPRPLGRTLARAARQTGTAAQGLWHLARDGGARPSSINGTITSPARRYLPVELPAAEVRRIAKALRVPTSDLLITVIADALHRFLQARGEETTGRTLRTMVPRTARTRATRGAAGNWTAALRMDVPIGPMGPRWRLDEVRSRMRRLLASGQPEASRVIMAGMGLLPPPLHRIAARRVYQDRWFNLIVSIVPGPRRRQHFAGAEIAPVFPVLPLADGVGLAIGIMPWGDHVGVGITADAGLVPDVDVLASAVRRAFADFARCYAQDNGFTTVVPTGGTGAVADCADAARADAVPAMEGHEQPR